MTVSTYPELAGKVALVTGSTAGIGKAVATGLAAESCKVVVNGTNVANGTAVVDEIRSGGGEAIFVAADVTDAAQVEGLIGAAVSTYGRLDMACNNAGHEGMGPETHTYTEELWDATMALNLTGTFLCMKHELAQMMRQSQAGPSRGAIVNVASIAGMVGGASPAYNASKHGMIGLTRQAGIEYADKGVRINAINPAMTRTPMLDRFIELDPDLVPGWTAMHPIGRFAEASEMFDAVAWLLSDRSSFVVGAAVPVDGGWTAR
jgi:NAD(P)-dependent dehydrogenase (short-subunit alcohol dehydrogenase family)